MAETPRIPRPVTVTRAGLAQWVLETCFLFGADLTTGLQVAALFVRDLEDTPDGVRPRG